MLREQRQTTDLQDLEALPCGRQSHVQETVKAARPEQRVVQRIPPVGGAYHQDLPTGIRLQTQYNAEPLPLCRLP